MDKIKNFISKYKAEIVIVLGAIISICTSIALLPNANAVLCSIIIAVVAAIIEVLKTGFSQTSIDLIAKAILLIIEVINKKELEKDGEVMSLSYKSTELTLEDIKTILTEE